MTPSQQDVSDLIHYILMNQRIYRWLCFSHLNSHWLVVFNLVFIDNIVVDMDPPCLWGFPLCWSSQYPHGETSQTAWKPGFVPSPLVSFCAVIYCSV